MKETDLRSHLKKLLNERRVGVLATHDCGQPYGTLVAFVASDDLRQIVFTTGRATRKFANLSADPRVALVVDDRSNAEADFYEASAVTATGQTRVLEGDDARDAQRAFLQRHPQLEAFVSAPSCAIVAISVKRYTYVSRFQQVFELDLK